MWTKEDSSSEVVERAWSLQVEGSHNYSLVKKCQKVRDEFIVWNRTCFGIIKNIIKEIEDKIKMLQDMAPTKENLELEASLNIELNDWMEREELKWKQKSRELWLKEGDRNSKFFHLSTLIRRRRNLIAEIQLDNGHWIHDRKDIEDYFANHFKEVFLSSSPTFPQDLEGLMEPCISIAENLSLSQIPNAKEIKDVVWEMNDMKAPGPDGLPRIFFKKYWQIVGLQVIIAIQSFFRKDWLLKQLNHTFITLIPKRHGARNFNQFRPINLCNFYYKVISKILVNRLRPLLAKIIDPAQLAFVPNQWIAENVVLAQEVVHSFRKTKKKNGYMGFKLDFHKAYDRLEWNFIIIVLRTLGLIKQSLISFTSVFPQ